MPYSNDPIIVDRFANVRRIEAVVKAMDRDAPIKTPSCEFTMSPPWHPAIPNTRAPESHPHAP